MPLQPLLDQSRASADFKADVLAYATHQPAERITVARHAPRVKVLRVITQLLHAEPALAVERVHVDAMSGCSDFRGVLTVACSTGVPRVFDFTWDCAWRAEKEGWIDAFGFPDQIRAARECGYQCFSDWEERESAATAPGVVERAAY